MANAGPASLKPVVKPGDTIYLRLDALGEVKCLLRTLSDAQGLQWQPPWGRCPRIGLLCGFSALKEQRCTWLQ